MYKCISWAVAVFLVVMSKYLHGTMVELFVCLFFGGQIHPLSLVVSYLSLARSRIYHVSGGQFLWKTRV